MRVSGSLASESILAAAVIAAVSAVSPAADRSYTGGTSTNGTAYLTGGNWTGGVYAGTYGSTATTSGTATDVGVFGSPMTILGTYVNFSTVNSLTGGPGYFSSGALVATSGLSSLGSTGTGTTLTVGGLQSTVTGNLAGIWQLNGAIVTTSAASATAPATLGNVIAAITDGATKNLTLTNQSVTSTATDGSTDNTARTATVNYRLGTTAANTYVTAGRTLSVLGLISEATAGSSITKYGTGTLTLGTSATSNSNTFTGGLNVNEGTVSFYSKANLGSGTIALNGGALALSQVGGSAAFTQTMSIGAAGGTLTFATASATSMSFNNAFTGTGRLTVAGNSGLAAGTVQGVASSGNATGSTISTTVTGGATLQSAFTSVFGTVSAFAQDALVLNNGTLTYTSAGASFVTGNRNGITVDVGGGTLGNTSALTTLSYNAPIAGTGTLTLAGAGSEKFTAVNTYTGPTVVSSGFAYDNGTHNNAGSYTVAAGATYGGSGTVNLAAGATISVAGTITGGSTSITGTGSSTVITPTVGTLTVNGDLSLFNGTTAGTFSADATASAIDKLAVSGLLDLTGSKLLVNGTLPTDGTPLILASYVTLVGTFSSVTLPSGFTGTIDYAYNGANQIALLTATGVPEPTTLGLAAVGVAGLLRRRRKA